MKRIVTIFLVSLLTVLQTNAALIAFTIIVSENDAGIKVNGNEIMENDVIVYTIGWSTSAPLSKGSHSTGKAEYANNSIQAGGSLIFNSINIATNNATDVVSAKKFEVTNGNGSNKEDKWKTEALFTNNPGANVTVEGKNGPVSIDSYTPDKIKVELKSKSIDFLSSNELGLATADLVANLPDAILSANFTGKDNKFEIKWKGNIDKTKDPKLLGTVSSIQIIPEPSSLSLLGLGACLLIFRRCRID